MNDRLQSKHRLSGRNGFPKEMKPFNIETRPRIGPSVRASDILIRGIIRGGTKTLQQTHKIK